MVKKRDGPAPFSATPGPGQIDERARLLPQPESPRKSGRTPSQHRRVRRRPPQGWRQFRVRVCLAPEGDAAALYVFLKPLARRHGLEVGDVQEVHEPTLKKETGPSA